MRRQELALVEEVAQGSLQPIPAWKGKEQGAAWLIARISMSAIP